MTDGPRVAVLAGEGIVLRIGSTVVVIGGSVGSFSAELVDDVTATIAEHHGDEQWRRLARLVLQGDDPPPLAVATLGTESASVFLYGDAELSAASERAHGTDHVLGVTREVAIADGYRVAVRGAGDAEPAPWSNLTAGAVSGAGIAVYGASDETAGLPRPTAAPAERDVEAPGVAVVEPLGAPQEPAVTEVAVEAPDEPAVAEIRDEEGVDAVEPIEEAPFESISLQVDVDLTGRQPLPIEHGAANGGDTPTGIAAAAEPAEAAGPAYERPVMVTGVYSPRGHFNHPDAKYCSRTGVKMGASHTRVLVEGPRPPLGVLTLDDGSTHTVQWNLVIGRGPANDERVQREEAGPLTIVDEEQSVSRAHALLELVEWDVLVSDLGSRNHTFVQDGPNAPRRQLAVGERAALRSGTIVHLGERSFVYHEHHVR